MDWKICLRAIIMVIGAIACLGIAVGLIYGHLPESNLLIKTTEVIIFGFGLVALSYMIYVEYRSSD